MVSVIIADDDPDLRDALAGLLALEGHAVRTASSGNTALKAFNQSPAQLIITDIMMDDGDGIELIRSLRRKPSGTRIIAISGRTKSGDMDYLHLAHRSGADIVLAKPFAPNDLLVAINACLGGDKSF